MKTVKITALRQTTYPELTELYENPLESPCDIRLGQIFFSYEGRRPEGFCPSAWETLAPFVQTLAEGGGNFFDGCMKNPHSALLSCNDGFRPMSFYVEAIEEETGAINGNLALELITND